jgi:hypothetical protein
MRLIVLDTGTPGLLTHPRAQPTALACRQWAQALLAAAIRVIVPGIADYELRRELRSKIDAEFSVHWCNFNFMYVFRLNSCHSLTSLAVSVGKLTDQLIMS